METEVDPKQEVIAVIEEAGTLAASMEGKPEQQDATITERRDIRKHPKYSFMYEVHKYNALYHVVERLGSREFKKDTLTRKLRNAYTEAKLQFPMLARFTAEILPKLGKRRIAMLLLGDFLLQSAIPMARRDTNYRLAATTIDGMRTGVMAWSALAQAIFKDLGGYVLEQGLDQFIVETRAKIAYRYSSYLKEKMMRARLGLDSVTLTNAKVRAYFISADKLLVGEFDNRNLVTELSGLINNVVKLLITTMRIYTIIYTHRSRLAIWSFLVKLAFMVKRYLKSLRYGSKTVAAITDPNYRSSNIMESASWNATAQDQMLGLQDYYLQEYQRAKEALGDVSPTRPDMWNNDDLLLPWRSLAFKTAEKMNDLFLCFVLAMNAVRNPAMSLWNASAVINDLNALQTYTWDFSYCILNLFRASQNLSDNMSPIEKYYTLFQLKPLLRKAAGSIDHVKVKDTENTPASAGSSKSDGNQPSSDSGHVPARCVDLASAILQHNARGMTIEFQSVSFTYPNKFKKALNNISFKIEAGFSGSGKSTLIALLVRLHDPDEGQILINGVDIKHYEQQELYKRISFLFQRTPTANFTIREFIRLGRLDATPEEIEQALKDSGADEVIKNFKRGLDTELEDRHVYDEAVTVDMLVKRAQNCDEDDLYWRGQVASEHTEGGDNYDDPRTDREILDKLDTVSTTALSDQQVEELNNWTIVACKEKLPRALEDEVLVLAKGYDATVDEDEEKDNQPDTATFSGGEWAKVVLARSFLRDSADLVILDEFSAALDPLNEASIFEKFMKRRGERTIIAVTHRFHLACRSDLILFLQNGELKEKGRHCDLMKMDGKYREMYLKTTNNWGKEVACQTVATDELTVSVKIVPDEKFRTPAPEAAASA